MFKLTKRSVEALEIAETDYPVWDAELPGFGVRVYPTGRKSYILQYRVGRRTRRTTIGRHGVLTADAARKQARRLLGSVASGEDPSAEKQAKRRAPTIAGLCDRFLEEYVDQHCKPATARDYRSIIRRFIRPRLGPLRIGDVTRADVVAFHHTLRETPYQANRAASMLSKLFNLAEDWGLRQAGSNPARRIKKFREEEKKRFLSEAEQERLGDVLTDVLADGSETIHTVSAILLLIYTGCRLGEILTLQWDFVTAHHLELPDSKTGRRRIPLPREAHDILMDLPRRDGNPYVILGEAETGPLVNLQKPWRRIRHLAGRRARRPCGTTAFPTWIRTDAIPARSSHSCARSFGPSMAATILRTMRLVRRPCASLASGNVKTFQDRAQYNVGLRTHDAAC